MAGTKLQQITKKAQAMRKSHPQTKWTDLIKKASKELSQSSHKKSKTMQKGKTVVVAGHHAKPATKSKKKVSGVKSKNSLGSVLKMLAGSILGGTVGAVVYNRVPGSTMVKGGAQLGLGVAGMLMIPERNNFLFGLATGIGTGGGVNLAHSAGVLHGIDDMVAGLFGDMNGNERYIEPQTAGHHQHRVHDGSPENAYVSAVTSSDIDKWIFEGLPGQGGDDWK